MSDKPWRVLRRSTLLDRTPYVVVEQQAIGLPDGRIVDDYYQLTLPDYVCVFAETADGKILAQRQYKHGVGQATLTFPAGLIHADERPLAAAQRELLEETGYAADRWHELGAYVTNANQRCNVAHLFRAFGCRAVSRPDPQDLEEIETVLMTGSELVAALRAGEVRLLTELALLALASHPALLDEAR